MASLKYIAEKMKEISRDPKGAELTPKVMKGLKRYFIDSLDVIRSNAKSRGTFSNSDLEAIGEFYFLLENFFPKGNVPAELRRYSDFIYGVARELKEDFSKIYEAKLREDERVLRSALKNGNVLEDPDNAVYARSFVEILGVEKPKFSTLQIRYQGEKLLDGERIPQEIFSGLPEGSVLVFDYTEQGLRPNLNLTLSESEGATKDFSLLEKIVLESLARDTKTIGYVTSVYNSIGESIS